MEAIATPWVKRPESPAPYAKTAHFTTNSASSGLIFMRISGFRDNPVKYTDPDGRALPVLVFIGKMVLGGTVSAAINYGSQVLGNVADQINNGVMLGEVDFGKALTDINIGEVGGAFVTGAIGGVIMPGVNSIAGNVNGSFAQRGVQAVGGALVNAAASVPATIVENGINNITTGSSVPLTSGMTSNAKVAAAAGFISGGLTKPTNIPSGSSQWYKDKQVINQSAIRQGATEVMNAIRDEGISRGTRKLLED
jgi:hypothetical protein